MKEIRNGKKRYGSDIVQTCSQLIATFILFPVT